MTPPLREPYLGEDGLIHIADPYRDQFGTDEPGGYGADAIAEARDRLVDAVHRYQRCVSYEDEHPEYAHGGDDIDLADERVGLAALELAQAWQASDSKPVGWPAAPERIEGAHEYLSTSCLHGHCGYCQAAEGSNRKGETWAKTPASCKFCQSPCVHGCHSGETGEAEPLAVVRQSDLRAILADAYALASDPAAFNRLAEAAGVVTRNG